MRASVPKPRMSCKGTMAVFETDDMMPRISTQWIGSSLKPRYARACACSLATSATVRVLSPIPLLVHQPTTVSGKIHGRTINSCCVTRKGKLRLAT